MGFKAIVIGATGATGTELIQLLVNDSNYDSVLAFSRRDFQFSHPKLQMEVIDFDRKETWLEKVQGDVLFSCLGTTLKAAGSKEKQWKIDHDYQLEFAKAAKQNMVPTYILVSASAASSKSSIFYSRMKGQLEDAVSELDFEKTIILRPPLLRRKNSNRTGEIMADRFLSFFNAIGLLRSQRPMPTSVLAKAMTTLITSLPKGSHTLEAPQIWREV